MRLYPRQKRFLFLFVAAGTFLYMQSAEAHIVPYMAVKTEIHAEGTIVKFSSEFGAATTIKEVEEADREQQIKRLYEYFADFFAILYGPTPEKSLQCKLVSIDDYRVDKEKKVTSINGTFDCPKPVEKIDNIFVVTDAFSDAFVKYDHYVSVYLGEKRKDFILNQWVLTNFPISQEVVDALFPAPPPGTINLARFEQPKIGQPQPTFLYIIKRFLRMGVEHILGGTDHILFLLSTILLLTSVRKMLVLVTAFTLAHSITLILAGLGIITLPSSFVEPFIAATIVVITAWNLVALWRGGDVGNIRERWIMAFAFGLVHGLGFAGALVDVDLPGRYFVPALLVFNIGVEIGQLLILLLVVPILLFVHKKLHIHRRIILAGALGIILATSVVWFIQRLS